MTATARREPRATSRHAAATAGVPEAAVTPDPEERIGTRLLAVDPSSSHVGLAFFDERRRVVWTKALRAPDRPWLERMRYLADALDRWLRTNRTIPDVVGMEDAVLGRNAKVAVTMGENRGYLLAVLSELYPGVRVVNVSPATVRSVVGSPRSRDGSKRSYKIAAAEILDVRDVTEDEADACIVGLAAYNVIDDVRRGIRRRRAVRRAREARPRETQLQLGAMA